MTGWFVLELFVGTFYETLGELGLWRLVERSRLPELFTL